ncbi:hypothetical protein [Actinoalloteichus caeruleus]|uniref:hypothetical protein n=1 Tax=Actinoalloteichus cyanogriseus TaxID=2893586 RepID=UPI0004AAABAA|nr:hypothetical protein [Actinoalloteichus caeruleus]
MSRSSHAAVARPATTERTVTAVVGTLALLAGLLALVVGAGWLGADRATRPVADPVAVDWLGGSGVLGRLLAVLVGLVLLVLGVRWALRASRPEHHPDVEFDDAEGELRVSARAVTEAVQDDARGIDGVSRARVTLVGSQERPALRLLLALRRGTDIRMVWSALENRVLARARDALGLERLPAAVHLELDAAERHRVR